MAKPRRKRLTPKQFQVIIDGQGGLCIVPGCVSEGPFEQEHSVPFTWTGDLPDAAMCIPCHRRKTTKDRKAIAKVNRLKKKAAPGWSERKRKKIPTKAFPKAIKQPMSGQRKRK